MENFKTYPTAPLRYAMIGAILLFNVIGLIIADPSNEPNVFLSGILLAFSFGALVVAFKFSERVVEKKYYTQAMIPSAFFEASVLFQLVSSFITPNIFPFQMEIISVLAIAGLLFIAPKRSAAINPN